MIVFLSSVFRLHRLLRRGFEISDLLSLGAQLLHGSEDGRLIGGEGAAELAGPVDLLAHHVDDRWKLHQRPHGGAETGFLSCSIERVALEFLVLQQPVARVEDFLGVDGRGEYLPHQLVRVERNRRHQLLERVRRPRRLRDGGRRHARGCRFRHRRGALCRGRFGCRGSRRCFGIAGRQHHDTTDEQRARVDGLKVMLGFALISLSGSSGRCVAAPRAALNALISPACLTRPQLRKMRQRDATVPKLKVRCGPNHHRALAAIRLRRGTHAAWPSSRRRLGKLNVFHAEPRYDSGRPTDDFPARIRREANK